AGLRIGAARSVSPERASCVIFANKRRASPAEGRSAPHSGHSAPSGAGRSVGTGVSQRAQSMVESGVASGVFQVWGRGPPPAAGDRPPPGSATQLHACEYFTATVLGRPPRPDKKPFWRNELAGSPARAR